MMDCEAVRDISLDAKQFFIRYRVSAILVGLTVVNLLLQYINANVITKFSAHKHYSPDTNKMMGVRFLQLLFGLIVGLSGYGMLLFNAITGCNASELYLFYFGGVLLLFLDLHEYVRSWPLRAPILGHHLMVFFFGLAIIEYDLIPDPTHPNLEISLATMLLIANIGLMWIADFFHVVFRVSTKLPMIKRCRKIYLLSAVIRPITLGLMVYSAVEAFVGGSIAAAIPSITLSLAYAYNLFKAIQFVYNFNCESYFATHQDQWEDDVTDDKEKALGKNKRFLSKILFASSSDGKLDNELDNSSSTVAC